MNQSEKTDNLFKILKEIYEQNGLAAVNIMYSDNLTLTGYLYTVDPWEKIAVILELKSSENSCHAHMIPLSSIQSVQHQENAMEIRQEVMQMLLNLNLQIGETKQVTEVDQNLQSRIEQVKEILNKAGIPYKMLLEDETPVFKILDNIYLRKPYQGDNLKSEPGSLFIVNLRRLL
ncbi:hypothetical protein GJ496_006865 [Pomphorhynchus laevis]|nr:hypothetical protein GJ496_006865 [Pomphorhynchus laevis]